VHPASETQTWTIEMARDVYNLAHWGNGYFDINDKGHVVVRPNPDSSRPAIDLYQLAQAFPRHDLTLPVLVRFSGILHHRVDELCSAFGQAMAAHAYRGGYTAVFPIKVNQQRSVVDALLVHGGPRVGLEAGSKPELLAVLARSREGAVVVCNGYKDREYIRLALIGKQLGYRLYIVIEKLSELDLVIAEARALGVKPLIGARVRLASIGAGKWQNTGGEKSKFGLSAADLIDVVERLRTEKMLDSLQMMHFHMGSQIANVQHIQLGIREAARYYAELRRLGADVRCVNVGGGLGIDYEGTRSRSFCSMNYTVQEYADQIVGALQAACADAHLPHPEIITESGRAMTAHHAVLITNVIDVEVAAGSDAPGDCGTDDPPVIQELRKNMDALSQRSPLEVLHEAVNLISQAQNMFADGTVDLRHRARAEQLYAATCQRVRQRLQPDTRAHREAFDDLNEKFADKYFLNFSLFQSIPDHWAIKQIFPVVPLNRLDEFPDRRGVLQDITCDSDGRVDLYVDGDGVAASVSLHSARPGEAYLVGIFLVGAYQEILGDMHNLFGDTDSVQVEVDEQGETRLQQIRRGDTVESVLRYVNFDPEELRRAYHAKISGATWLNSKEKKLFFDELSAGLSGYTYLED
jgi:arginine decarboxylase